MFFDGLADFIKSCSVGCGASIQRSWKPHYDISYKESKKQLTSALHGYDERAGYPWA